MKDKFSVLCLVLALVSSIICYKRGIGLVSSQGGDTITRAVSFIIDHASIASGGKLRFGCCHVNQGRER